MRQLTSAIGKKDAGKNRDLARRRSTSCSVGRRSVSVSVSTEALFDTRNGYIIFLLPPVHPRVPSYPLQDGRSCLQNGACATRVIRPPCPPSPRSFPTVAFIPLDPQRLYPAGVGEALVSSPSCFIPLEDFSPSAGLHDHLRRSPLLPPLR